MFKNFVERPHKNEKDEAIQYVKELLSQARADNRNEDIEKLEELVRLLHIKKYGLVWEEHTEMVEEEMKTKIPVFIEDESRKIVGNPDSADYNFLLEGDNLHSLHLLEKRMQGRLMSSILTLLIILEIKILFTMIKLLIKRMDIFILSG